MNWVKNFFTVALGFYVPSALVSLLATGNTGNFVLLQILAIMYGVSGALYFIPSITAFTKKKKNKIGITVLNTFVGWTVIGWVGSLVWASTED